MCTERELCALKISLTNHCVSLLNVGYKLLCIAFHSSAPKKRLRLCCASSGGSLITDIFSCRLGRLFAAHTHRTELLSMAIVSDNVIRRKGYDASYERDRFERRFHNEFFPLSRVHAIISFYANTPLNRIFCLLWMNRTLILHAAFHFVNRFCRCDSERSHMQMSHYNAMHK